ncbi:MAG TPA: CoA ester lyase [Alphaproteobacteria bacterium]|jgi:citrate lyase subunit beta / citryl-CoA lyase|nr:CoA ester lyase [Alphaproteobacteria bacterium]
MANKARPRRSVLYMPGSNARAMDKARTLPADALILDLEDAVAPDAKEQARQQVCAALREGGYGKREMIVRINALESPWGMADLLAAAAVKPDAVLVPKVSSPSVLHRAEAILESQGAHDTSLWAMMETPLGILHAESIASATPRLAVFVMGTNDIAKEMRSAHTPMRLPMITSLGLCMLAARAFDVAVIDGVYNDIKDEAGFAAICRQGQELGMDGKTLIHPSQVGPCNEIFSPTPAEIETARKIIAEFAKPENAGKGVVTVDGRMTELLHAEIAKRTVAIAEAIRELAT